MKGIYMWSIWLFNNFGMKYLSRLSYMFILIVHYPLLLQENNVTLSRLMEIPVRKCQLTIALKVIETEEGIRPSSPTSPFAVPFISHQCPVEALCDLGLSTSKLMATADCGEPAYGSGGVWKELRSARSQPVPEGILVGSSYRNPVNLFQVIFSLFFLPRFVASTMLMTAKSPGRLCSLVFYVN